MKRLALPCHLLAAAMTAMTAIAFAAVEVMPTGGVTPETVGEFLKAGAFATAAGSALVSAAALKARDWPAITARAQQFVAAAAKV